MAIVNGYITLAEFKTFTGVTGDTEDAFFEDCIEQACRFIDDATGKRQYSHSFTDEQVDIYGESPSGFILEENKNYVTGVADNLAITGLSEGGTALTAGDDYNVYKDRIVKRSGVFTSEMKDGAGTNAITISGTIGYTDTTAPNDLKKVVLEISAIFARKNTRKIISEGTEFQETLNEPPEWINTWIATQRRLV